MAEHTPGAAVRAARLARGLSLRALAGRVGVSPATMSAIETGRTPLTVDRLIEVAQVLEVPPTRLLTDAGTPAPAPAPAPASASAPTLAGVPAPASATVAGAGGGDWRLFGALELGPVLAAALRIFVARGYHAATMREVAAEAGLSVAGVYHHHASKQDMLVRLLDLTMADIRWRLLAARDAEEGELGRFARMVEALALFHALRGDLAFLGASEMRSLAPEERVRIAALRDEVQHLLDEQAERAVAADGGKPVDVRTATRAVATMCTALPSWFRPGGPLSARQVARRYADYALALLRTG
ncbi:TetR family transcriptional regulator [Nonomuraea sp. MCN248]|uniref:TetR family transcriptional regulator n=1 Tax=Nonomuraea corallina TaxID=2989783 RepID=A0ABT4SG22_9ACTN|nr:TetR family transcriptional regulator [Nonomuraea corallina]MDA0636159.1 TetR family transcriptional regulator [Nonomuraea corallina]